MAGSRRLSQRISEGDGIAVIACVEDAGGARDAEAQGAKALAIAQAIEGIRDATTLPLLWIGRGEPADADAIRLRDEDELELALEQRDPEIFLLTAPDDDDEADPLDAVLELLPDVPAGKLAIARVDVSSRDEVLALERAGIDAVLVNEVEIAHLVGHRPLDV